MSHSLESLNKLQHYLAEYAAMLEDSCWPSSDIQIDEVILNIKDAVAILEEVYYLKQTVSKI